MRPCDDAIKAEIKVFASERLDIETEVQKAEVIITTLPGYVLHEETLPDGRKRYWAEHETLAAVAARLVAPPEGSGAQ